jgi:hypothetical protein
MANNTSPAPLPRAYERPSWLTELLLLLRPSRQELRIQQWKEHAQTWTEMAAVKCTDRITFLSGHLDILDRKFGTLLQFQGLLPIAITTLLSGMKVIPNSSFRRVLAAFTVSWLVNTAICLRGVRRLEWGDLWRYIGRPAEGEDNHIDRLIPEIVLRTAQFRIASAITMLEVLLIAALVGISIYLLP